MKDACYKKIKAAYKVWPSARASQALAKCRKEKGNIRISKAGSNLHRWEKEKWKDKKTGKPCGHSGKGIEYCRPTKKISSRTPKVARGKHLKKLINIKNHGGNPRV